MSTSPDEFGLSGKDILAMQQPTKGVRELLNLNQNEDLQKTILNFFPHLEAIYLFGSQANGSAFAESDIDLAFVLATKPDPEIAYALKSALSYLLRHDIDLVDFLRADTVTQAQIVAFGKIVWAKFPSKLAAMETTVFSKYALLNEERRDIIADIIHRGAIRG